MSALVYHQRMFLVEKLTKSPYLVYMKKINLLLFPAFLLIACSSTPSNYKNISSYEESGSFVDASIIIKEAKKGLPQLLLMASSSCSHCQTFEPIYDGALSSYPYNISLLYDTTATSSTFADQLFSYQMEYGSDINDGGIDGAYPRLYLLNQDGCQYLDFYNSTSTSQAFSNYLNSKITKTNVLTFSSFTSYSNYCSKHTDLLTYFGDSNDNDSLNYYATKIYPLAINSSLRTAFIDYQLLTSEEQQKVLSSLKITSFASTLCLGTSQVDIVKDTNNASKLLGSYYQDTPSLTIKNAITQNGDLYL
jgi:thiol-disulfide isomerase/thioredoxin